MAKQLKPVLRNKVSRQEQHQYNTSQSGYNKRNESPWTRNLYKTATNSRKEFEIMQSGNVEIEMHSQNRKPPNKHFSN